MSVSAISRHLAAPHDQWYQISNLQTIGPDTKGSHRVAPGPPIAHQPHSATSKALTKVELKYDPNSRMDRIRMFDARNPLASKAIAVTAIVASSAVIGAALGYVVDELAHLTNRKNDKVGIVFGSVIALLMAVTHTVMLFGVPKRFERRFRLGDFHPDSKSSFGQARQFMEDASLPLLKAFERNAEANLGVAHNHIIVNEAHIRDAINHIQDHGVPKSIWRGYLVEVGKDPIPNAPCFKTTHAAERVGIKANTYYTTPFRSTQDLLQRDWNHVYDPTHSRVDEFFEMLAPLKKNKEKTEEWRAGKLEFSSTDPQKARQQLKDAFTAFVHSSEQTKKLEIPSTLFDHSHFTDKDISDLRDFAKDFSDQKVAYRPSLKLELSAPNKVLYTKVMSATRSVFRDDPIDSRTWQRVDEFTKLSPQALSGLRPPTIYTALRNLGDSFTVGLFTASSGEMQGRSTGASIGMYLPLMLMGSVISVLGLGISSTSPAAPNPVVPESGPNKGGSSPQQFSGSLFTMGMAESVGHPAPLPQHNPYAQQPSFMQGVNYSPSALSTTA
jgi:hypothetical protein